ILFCEYKPSSSQIIKDPYEYALDRYTKTIKKMDSLPAKIGYGSVPMTPPLRPKEEKKHFHLPPGFKITLFASEPDIGRPINMSFDGKGRLWVTQSALYPYPVDRGFKNRI